MMNTRDTALAGAECCIDSILCLTLVVRIQLILFFNLNIRTSSCLLVSLNGRCFFPAANDSKSTSKIFITNFQLAVHERCDCD